MGFNDEFKMSYGGIKKIFKFSYILNSMKDKISLIFLLFLVAPALAFSPSQFDLAEEINYSNIVINETSNQTEYWNTNVGSLDGVNGTQFESQSGNLGIKVSWLETFINALSKWNNYFNLTGTGLQSSGNEVSLNTTYTDGRYFKPTDTRDLTTTGNLEIGPTTGDSNPVPLIIHTGGEWESDQGDVIEFPDIYSDGTLKLKFTGYTPGSGTGWQIENGFYDGKVSFNELDVLGLSANSNFKLYNSDATKGIDVTIGEDGDNSNLIVEGDIKIDEDNKCLYLGAGQDACIKETGSGLVINREVGSYGLNFTNFQNYYFDGVVHINKTQEVKNVFPMDWYTGSAMASMENGFYGRRYDDSTNKFSVWQGIVPLDQESGTDVTFYFTWMPTVTQSGDKTVRFRFGPATLTSDTSWASPSYIYQNYDLDTDEAARTIHQGSYTFSSVEPGTLLSIDLFRDADDADDTCVGDVFIPIITHCEYTKNKLGEEI
jgi:hypothetical protein